MKQNPSQQGIPRTQILAERTLAIFERFLHVEAVSGIALLAAAGSALLWANSPGAATYNVLWHTPFSFALGGFEFSQTLRWWINDALMTVFFLVIGMEVRREIHEGALASLRLAALPLAAALGGVIVPALVYLTVNGEVVQRRGWAVPTATDVAFAVGVLALLSKSIPSNVRVYLLALAIVDDIVAIIIIAAFYSGGLDYRGFLIAGIAILMVLGLQTIGVSSASFYVLPGAILWVGLNWAGVHPTLAGVVLGLMTPVLPRRVEEQPLDIATRAVDELRVHAECADSEPNQLIGSLRQLRQAHREFMPPATRVQMALHPWVAFGIMPLFALANAGVSLDGIDLTVRGSQSVMLGVLISLVLGKPMGVITASWLAVRSGWCCLPPAVTWSSVCLVGLLAGIGFTMSIFIATLAFSDQNLLAAAKLSVLLASLVAGLFGLVWGKMCTKGLRSGAKPGPI